MRDPSVPTSDRQVNPLLFVVFCPHCVASGLFALAATGVVTMPALFGVPFEHYLAPALVLGSFLTWLAWGRWARAKQTCFVEDGPPSASADAGA